MIKTQINKGMMLQDLSWNEVKEYLSKKKDIILPFGSVEEHGYHLPLSTDSDIALAIAKKLGEELGILVAPVVWYGVANTTKDYVGSVMVSFDALRLYTKEILKSLERQGFKRVFLISGHLSSSQKHAIKEAAKETGLEAYLLDFSKIDFGDIVSTTPVHACEAETSLMLYLYPEKVKMEKAIDEEVKFNKYAVGGSLVKTKSGVFGHPTKATREKGEKIFKRIISEFKDFICSL